MTWKNGAFVPEKETGPKQDMSRTTQTLLIVGAIFAAVIGYFIWESVTNPNLDGLSDYQRCDYYAFWHNRYASVDECHQKEAMAAADRLAHQY